MYQTNNIFRNKKLIALLFLAVFITCPSASAGAVTGFNPGRIIDDIVMANKQSMTVDQIQAFLNSKVPNCDTNGAIQ